MIIRSERAGPVEHLIDAPTAALIKGMLARGDRQSDIAAFFGCNGGRVSEINRGQLFPEVPRAPDHELPPPGPYFTPAAAWRMRHQLEKLHNGLGELLQVIS